MPDGKPPGKRNRPVMGDSHPFFLEGGTRYEVMMQLVRARKGKQGAPDFSELMQALLEKWLARPAANMNFIRAPQCRLFRKGNK